ncbi:MAG TPA: VOC family protein [Candidatus Dormibacteraeota bacterium]
MTLTVLGIDNVLLAVGDYHLARDFYGGKLGLPVKFEFEQVGLIGFRLGGEEPGLLVRVQEIEERAADPAAPRFWLEVPDARTAAAQLIEAGLEPLGEEREINTGWVVEFADPWGNVFGITDYVKQPERARKLDL